MTIKLGSSKHRRSYADYKPPKRKRGPRDDPFRVIFYLALIAGAGWVYFNADRIKAELSSQINSFTPPVVNAGETPTIVVSPDEAAVNAQAAYDSGNLTGAIELYQQAADAAPNSVEFHVQLARLLLFRSGLEYGPTSEQTLKDALDAANGAINADPERPEGYAIYGKVLDWSGKAQDGATQILRALEINADYAPGQSYLAEALVDLQRYDQAQQAIQLAIGLDPRNPDVLRDYGYIMETLGDYAGAVPQYEASLQIDPNQSYLKLALARTYRVLGRYDDALDLFFAVDTVHPQNALVQFELGLTYETFVGDPTSAVEYYENATKDDPEFPPPWVRLGTLRYLQNSFDKAIPAFERALALGVQNNADLYLQLGLSYAYQNQCAQAVENLAKAQSLVGEDEEKLQLIEDGYALCPPGNFPTAPARTPTPTPKAP